VMYIILPQCWATTRNCPYVYGKRITNKEMN
jgi:hypothetical protein